MGGGGSRSGYFGKDPSTLKKQLQRSETQTKDAAHEAKVADLLSSLLTEFNDRDYDAINRHLEEIKEALEAELEGTVDLKYGGSVAKHTYVDGLSDIDSLVILDSCELADQSPENAKEYFAQRLKEQFPDQDIQPGTLAVTIYFADAEIQLLPAISCQNHVKIADKSGKEWAMIKPKEFTEILSRTNQQLGRKVVPTVKLAKAIIDTLPKKHQISGYHAESLAIEVFKDYTGALKPKDMLKHYFQRASRLVLQPIKDKTGQSVHVDEYLGDTNTLERKIVSDAFARVSRRMTNADNANSVEGWHKLFE
jgi:hypothetical protein